MPQRRLPEVSPWASQFVEPDPREALDVEAGSVRLRPTLMQRAAQAQADARERSREALRHSWVAGLSGWGCMILTFFDWPWHIGTVLWIAAVLLWVVAFFQWSEFIVERKASRMYPDPDDLAR